MDTILNLLNSAELCNERGRHKMAKLALAEIWAYIEQGVSVSDETYERILALDEEYSDDPDYHLEPSVPDAQGLTTCDKCNGTGKYKGNGRACYACKGKKFQDASDRARNASYWAHKERLRELRKSVTQEI